MTEINRWEPQPEPAPPVRLTVNVTEAAEMLGVCPELMRRAVKAGDIPSFKFGPKRILIPVKALEEFVAAQTADQ